MLIAGQGCVVNISCIKGSKPQPGLIGYCMAKAGLEMVTKSAAIELARFGVRVNCVSSSYLNTNFYRTAGLNQIEIDSIMQKEADTNPMGRTANIEEVCQAVIHMSSQHSRMVTGQIIHADGGKNLTIRGQQAWYGMQEGTGKAFEVGESSSFFDFMK
jgi:3-oxoacyl-[acyl-carrier protein] reductase